MDSTVKAGFKEGKYIIYMDEKVEKLRKEIWKTIFSNKKDLPYADIAMALGIVQYELLHHSDESKS